MLSSWTAAEVHAYVEWGLVSKEESMISVTDTGRDFARAPEEQRRKIVAKALCEIEVYFTTFEYIHHNSLYQLSLIDIGAYWGKHFPSLASSAERTLKEQVLCFAKLVDFTKVGTYVVGRKGKESRLIFDPEVLKGTVSREELEDSISETDSHEHHEGFPNQAKDDLAATNVESPTRLPNFRPAIHIDIQIHVSPDSDEKQIDQIFASMAKHLFPE